MRELKLAELDAAIGGGAPEFHTVIRHEIPRFDKSPARWQLERSGASPEAQTCTPMRWLPPRPIPMHWLPPRDTEWQEF